MLAPWGRLGPRARRRARSSAIVALSWRASRGASAWRRATMIGLRARRGGRGAGRVPRAGGRAAPGRARAEPDRDPDRRLAARCRSPRARTARRASSACARCSPPRRTTLDAWERDHKIDYYTFTETRQRDDARTALAPATAQGKATLIRKALEHVRGRYEGRDLAGIVLISDGAATGGFDEDSGDGAVRDFLRSLDTRVHTVWAARDRPQGRRGREGHGRRVRVRAHRRADRGGDPHDRPAGAPASR